MITVIKIALTILILASFWGCWIILTGAIKLKEEELANCNGDPAVTPVYSPVRVVSDGAKGPGSVGRKYTDDEKGNEACMQPAREHMAPSCNPEILYDANTVDGLNGMNFAADPEKTISLFDEPQKKIYGRIICVDKETQKPVGGDYRIDKESTTIGRGSSCDIVLKDVTVSRRQAIIQVRDSKILIQDLKSMNGTIVDGVRLEPEASQILKQDSFILLGKSLLQFVVWEQNDHE